MNKIEQDWEIISNHIMSILDVISKLKASNKIFDNPLYKELKDIGFTSDQRAYACLVLIKYNSDDKFAILSDEEKIKEIIYDWKLYYGADDYEKLMRALEKSVVRC